VIKASPANNSHQSLRLRLPLLVMAAACLLPVLGTAARADCKEDIEGIMKRRMGAVQALNALSKKNGNKLDPIAACPQLRALASIEAEATAYFTKNGEWCNLPPDFTQKMSDAHAKTVTFATKACQVAVQVKKMQQQQQTQQAQQAAEAIQKLPAGPL
jgi:hypothetical protein